jgi:hypothetical protein
MVFLEPPSTSATVAVLPSLYNAPSFPSRFILLLWVCKRQDPTGSSKTLVPVYRTEGAHSNNYDNSSATSMQECVWTISFSCYYNKTVHRSHNKSPILANLLNRFHPQCSYFNWHKSVVTSRRVAGAIRLALSPDRCHATYRRECEPFAAAKRFMCDAHTKQFLQQVPPNIHMKSSLSSACYTFHNNSK